MKFLVSYTDQPQPSPRHFCPPATLGQGRDRRFLHPPPRRIHHKGVAGRTRDRTEGPTVPPCEHGPPPYIRPGLPRIKNSQWSTPHPGAAGVRQKLGSTTEQPSTPVLLPDSEPYRNGAPCTLTGREKGPPCGRPPHPGHQLQAPTEGTCQGTDLSHLSHTLGALSLWQRDLQNSANLRRGCSRLESAWVTSRRMKGGKNWLLAALGLGSLE